MVTHADLLRVQRTDKGGRKWKPHAVWELLPRHLGLLSLEEYSQDNGKFQQSTNWPYSILHFGENRKKGALSSRLIVFNQGWFAPPSYPPAGHLAMFGDIKTINVTAERDATGIYWVEDKNAAKHPTVCRTALPIQRINQSKMSIMPRVKKSYICKI